MRNLLFALTIEPDNLRIQQKLTWAKNQQQAGQSTIPSTIEEEMETNPFKRVDQPDIQVYLLPTYQLFKRKKLLLGSSGLIVHDLNLLPDMYLSFFI